MRIQNIIIKEKILNFLSDLFDKINKQLINNYTQNIELELFQKFNYSKHVI